MTPTPPNRFVHPTALAWILLVAVVGTLYALGFWQIARLQWKEALIQEIETAREAPPLAELPQEPEAIKALAFKRVQLEGSFLYEYEFHLAARYYRGTLGYHILTPFRLKDGRIVILNRGWVPAKQKEASTRSEGNMPGTLSLICMVRTDPDRNWFTPKNQPEKNIWFARDINEMAASKGLSLASPYPLDVLYTTPPGGVPKPFDGAITLRNDHFSYAFIWFSLGTTALIIFLLYHRRKLDS